MIFTKYFLFQVVFFLFNVMHDFIFFMLTQETFRKTNPWEKMFSTFWKSEPSEIVHA